MLTEERQNSILEILKKEKTATVHALARQLYVSEATIRRDLTEMEMNGLLRRSHGGAVLLERDAGEPSFFVRKEENATEKRAIAQAVLPHLVHDRTFFLDASSTVRTLATVWDTAGKTLITTGIETALLFSRQKDVEIILPGGGVHYLSGAVCGVLTLRQLEDFRADVFLCSCGGISSDGALTESTIEHGEIKASMLRRAKKNILLVDHTKFSRFRTYAYAKLQDFDMLVTDEMPPDAIVELCRLSGVEIVLPARS